MIEKWSLKIGDLSYKEYRHDAARIANVVDACVFR